MVVKASISQSRPVSALLAVLVTLVASFAAYRFGIPNPIILLAVVMIAFTVAANNVAGAASGICIVFYALFFFSDDHSFVRFSPENAYKCATILISLALIYVIVALVRKKRDAAQAELMNLNAQLARRNENLRNESDHDPLTGVYNRRGGNALVSELIRVGEDDRPGTFQAVLAELDIDDFKEINDVYGHGAGDGALRHFAACLKAEFSEHAVLMRYGGDEFHLFLYGDDCSAIQARVEAFSRRTFEFAYREREIVFHASCGYAIYPQQADSQKELYRKADAALYYVKMSGKQKALLYSEEIDPSMHGGQQLSMRGVAENLPVAFLVYRADESEKILLASNSLIRMCECGSLEEFRTLTGGTFRGFVHPDDLERVQRGVDAQIAANPNKLDEVDYRIVTAKGRTLHIHDLGRLVEDENLGNLFYVAVYDRNAVEAEASGA